VKPAAFHREADAEFIEALQHYTDINPELGGRFYDIIKGLIAEACQTPGTFRFIPKPARRHFTANSLTASSTSNAPPTSGSSPSSTSAVNPATGSTA
jgi:hypothetical protein